MVAEQTHYLKEDIAAWRSPVHQKNAAKALWAKPGIREAYSQRMQALWEDPTFREEQTRRIQAAQSDPELRARKSLESQALWKNDKFRTKMLYARKDPEYKAAQSESQGGIRVAAYGLLLRGGTTEEIAQITGREARNIKNLKSRLRETGELPKPTKEEVYKARSKAFKGKPRNSSGRIFDLDRQLLMKVASNLNEKGFFQEDLQHLEAMRNIYKEAKRMFPEEFETQLILEAYTRARITYKKDITMRAKAKELEELVSNERFTKIQKEFLFIQARTLIIRTVGDNETISPDMFKKYLLQDEKGDIILPFRNFQEEFEFNRRREILVQILVQIK